MFDMLVFFMILCASTKNNIAFQCVSDTVVLKLPRYDKPLCKHNKSDKHCMRRNDADKQFLWMSLNMKTQYKRQGSAP